MSYTPGPWKILEDREWKGRHRLHDFRYITTNHEPDENGSFAHMEEGSYICDLRDSANIDDNARLIAAAPEMKEALGDLLEWATLMGGWDSPAWERAQQAYNKAEGR